MADIEEHTSYLTAKAVSESTTRAYNHAIHRYCLFASQYSIPQPPPISIINLIHFISYLSLLKLSQKTIKSYISGIAYHCKMYGHNDPTNHFRVRKHLKAVTRQNPSKDARLPITADILAKVLQALPHVSSDGYEATLFKAAFTLAYFGLLRVSEFTATKQLMAMSSKRILLAEDCILKKHNLSVRQGILTYAQLKPCQNSWMLDPQLGVPYLFTSTRPL